jgi:capsular exopolysaccharide synthesis family protein
MLFTSTQANEGKSTTALAIARSLASVGSRVLIIDGDMRNPSLHRNLKQPMAHGVSDVLSGKIQWNEAIQPIGSSGLSVMLAGRMPLNPAELLATDGFDKLMENVGHAFDHVIVDGPPVLGLADSILLARSCESTVFVIEAGRTRASQARMAINRLNAVRANILGAILTKLDAKEQGYGDNYGYQYAYAQQKEPKKLSEILKLR